MQLCVVRLSDQPPSPYPPPLWSCLSADYSRSAEYRWEKEKMRIGVFAKRRFSATVVLMYWIQVSYTFSRDFIMLLQKDGGRVTDFGKTAVLVKALRRVNRLNFDWRLCEWTLVCTDSKSTAIRMWLNHRYRYKYITIYGLKNIRDNDFLRNNLLWSDAITDISLIGDLIGHFLFRMQQISRLTSLWCFISKYKVVH